MRPDEGGGGGSSSVDTQVDGNAAAIATISTWLTGTVKRASSDFADTMFAQQSKAGSAWHGDAGEGFAQQVKTTGTMGDGVSTEANSAAGLVDTLSAGMKTIQGAMRDARQTAAAKGLTVSGTLITLPGTAPADVPDLPAGATGTEVTAHAQKVAAVDAWNLKVAALIDLAGLVEDAKRIWAELISAQVDSWTEQKGNLMTLLTGGLSAGLEGGMSSYYGNKFANLARLRTAEAARLKGLVPEPGGLGTGVAPRPLPANATALQIAIEDARMRAGVANPKLANDLLDKTDVAAREAENLKRTGQLAEDGKLAGRAGRVLKGGGIALAGIGTGFGIYADIQDGESTAQAVVSNGGGLVASIAVGAAIGTAIPVPVVGTVVGALGGAVVGIVASGMIDSLWENGLDSAEDVGQAFLDGGKELLETGEAIGDLAGDVAGGIADGAKDVFNSIF